MDLKKEENMQLPNIFKKKLQWISLILRISIFSLFAAAAMSKFDGGVAGTVAYFSSIFEETWLPLVLIKPYAAAVMFIEIGLAIWILIGIRLRTAWIVTGLFTITLAFGMLVAGEYGTASDNYIYVLICSIGLLLNEFDHYSLDSLLNGKHSELGPITNN